MEIIAAIALSKSRIEGLDVTVEVLPNIGDGLILPRLARLVIDATVVENSAILLVGNTVKLAIELLQSQGKEKRAHNLLRATIGANATNILNISNLVVVEEDWFCRLQSAGLKDVAVCQPVGQGPTHNSS
jgi:hypothetical protein